MKKIIYTLLIITSVNFISCKSEVKKENSPKAEKTSAYNLKNANHLIGWTAFKTTEKVPVNGQFKKIDILKNGEGNTIKEAINNTEFSIPVSSIFTKNSGRDYKIKKFFFGIMDNTKLLSGKLILENDSIGYSNLTMNGITKKLNFKYTITNKVFKLKTQMKISDWSGEKALNSINNVCKDLHKGADGISKTWNDVEINIASTFK